MNLRRSLAAKAAVSLTAASMLLASGGAAMAQEESPAPEATTTEEEVTTTDEEVTTTEEEAESTDGDAPKGPNTPTTNTFALGQSMQIRVNADGEPNSGAINFRWSVSQLTVQGPPDGSQDGDYTVPVPEGGDLPRYLHQFGFPSAADGLAEWDVSVENGYANARTVSLYPQDAEPAISLDVKFTLDGEPITAKELVGKSGVVTAKYKLTNNTTSPTEVEVKDLSGNPVKVTVDADTPLVAIAQTLLPYRYVGLNVGTAVAGADGRGHNQVQWIALPFRPLSGDGTATFGWSAHVTDAVIPSMLIQVGVLHIPAHEDNPDTPQDESQGGGTGLPINLDPALSEIQNGLANVVGGLDQLFAGGGEDPLVALEGRLNELLAGFGTNLQAVSENLQPTIDGLTQVVDILNQIDGPLSAINENWDAITSVVNTVAGTPALVLRPVLNQAGVPDIPPFGNNDGTWTSEETKNLINTANSLKDQMDSIGGQISIIAPLLSTLVPVVEGLLGGLEGLQSTLAAIGGNVPVADLPSLDSIITSVVNSVLTSPGGQQLTLGLGQVQSGVSNALGEVSAFAAQAIAALQGGVANVDQILINLKASLGGLLAKSAESPLVYGPLPEGTPDDTVLAGAYEFRIDAADSNGPNTLPRILVGLLALIAGGLVVKFVGGRSAA